MTFLLLSLSDLTNLACDTLIDHLLSVGLHLHKGIISENHKINCYFPGSGVEDFLKRLLHVPVVLLQVLIQCHRH
jgi:hypothetical protein